MRKSRLDFLFYVNFVSHARVDDTFPSAFSPRVSTALTSQICSRCHFPAFVNSGSSCKRGISHCKATCGRGNVPWSGKPLIFVHKTTPRVLDGRNVWPSAGHRCLRSEVISLCYRSLMWYDNERFFSHETSFSTAPLLTLTNDRGTC